MHNSKINKWSVASKEPDASRLKNTVNSLTTSVRAAKLFFFYICGDKLCCCPQTKKTYEQKCRDKEEADQNLNRNTNTNNTKQLEKVQ